ncbi:CHAD domain-containing protein, partial [Roseisolibacter sp. H3M3-2]|uniref:CHAD domain-containing protein n=1 Tax=Roseisolibacter sp. H3M3-2 TaxID=3031323 RepID=UPI0023DBF84D
MAPTLPADLLARSPEEAVRRIVHALLTEASAARERLSDAKDAEALHDFRVAVRRLRSTERAYRDALEGSFGGRARRLLRKIARATGASRDLEVHLEWLDGQRGSLTSRNRPGAAWLRDRWRAAKVDADRDLAHEVGVDFDRLTARLARRLPVYWQKVRIDEPVAERRFSALLAARLRAAAAELGERLSEIDGPEAIEAAHEARIAGKRVRYLLEPVAALTTSAPPVLKRLKRMQDVLGELHDLDVLADEFARALTEADAEAAARAAAASVDATPVEAVPVPAAAEEGAAEVDATPPPDDATASAAERQVEKRRA